jgi:ectoine hydroxylase-related dioxygenase (phytanoyl-CoA dioxygenase family)
MKFEREILGAKIFSGLEVDQLVDDLTHLILSFFQNEHDVSGSALQDFDDWLIATEKEDLGITGAARTFFKVSPVVREIIKNSNLVQNISEYMQEALELHDVVRLRTVMSGVGYTVSRPHQDIALWQHDAHALNVWIPLVNIDKNLSPIKVYNDTYNIVEHYENEYKQQELTTNQLTGLSSDIITMNVGEVLIFSPTQIHHSTENSTKKIRWSVDFRLKRKNV